MKNVAIFFAALLLVFSAYAGDVTIRMDNQSKYDVYIDGRSVNYHSNRNDRITLNNLSNGRHNVEVYLSNSRNTDSRNANNRGWGDRGSESRNNRGYQAKGRLVHRARFTVKPQTDVWISIDRKGKTKIVERRSKDRYGRNDGYNNHRNDDYNNRRNDGSYGGNYGGNYGSNYNLAMSSYEFDQEVNKIRSKWLGKLSYAKDVVNKNYFYTSQVRQILEIFSSEKDRLELAKLAYYRTVDQQNFREIYSLFSYQAQAELDRSIGRSRY